MDTTQFLDRVVGPGWFAVAHKSPSHGGMIHAFFAPGQRADGAALLKSSSAQGRDAYFAPAGFASANGRTQVNAEALRAFWVDIDVKREGDNKVKGIYPDRPAALRWLSGFHKAVGLPKPNVLVNSGFGFHAYWVLEDALPRAEWQLHADKLADALRTSGFLCESGITKDAARILRPPGTINQKGATALVTVQYEQPNYPTQQILSALQPLGSPGTALTTVVTSPLAGGGPAAGFAGVAAPNMAAAAQANLKRPRDHEFARIIGRCGQVELSMKEHGKNDGYQLWYLGLMSLAHHCSDRDLFIHQFSDGHVTYKPADVQAAADRVFREKKNKDTGPPRCTAFDGYRSGICGSCPHFGKLVSPWTLGADNGDLPPGYRRDSGWIEKRVLGPNGTPEWRRILEGDVFSPILDLAPSRKGFALNWIYKFAASQYPVRAVEAEIPSDIGAISSFFSSQSVALEDNAAVENRKFIMAWIKHLRKHGLQRTELIFPWGYSVDIEGERTGLAVGGELFRPDGSMEAAPGGDPQFLLDFTPRGDRNRWRTAFDRVCTGRIDLQTIVACSFGAPLMDFTGQPGLLISAWSGGSGVGKSSALKVGQAVWGVDSLVTSSDPTENALIGMLGTLKVMPFLWDEMQVGKDSVQIVKGAMNVSLGTSRRRMDAHANLRAVSTWRTLVVVCANQPLMDHIKEATANTDATALRCFEFEIFRPSNMVDAPGVAQYVADLAFHYGHHGREYAQWIARNLDRVHGRIKARALFFNEKLYAGAEERLYIAGLAAITCGAEIANELGIANFDMRGLLRFVMETFRALRAARMKNLVANNGAFDVHRLLGDYLTERVGNKIVTWEFAKRGPRPKDWECWMSPPLGVKAAVHIAFNEKILRINREDLAKFSRSRHLSITSVLDQFKRQLNAVEDMKGIGDGTDWNSGRVAVIDIDLAPPDMEVYLPTPPPGKALATLPSLPPAQALVAGNKARV